jgi:DNA-binding GntR family transcriptional regulator
MSTTMIESTLTRNVYETLRDLIMDGKFRPGERLVRRKVAKQLGISYVPVTEALYMLECDGLVENLPKYGCHVRQITLEQIQNDFVIREALECQSARIAAEKGTDEQFSRLLRQAIRLDHILFEADTSSTLGMGMHAEFHLAIAKLSHLEIFIAEVQKIWRQRLARLIWFSAICYKKPPKGWHELLLNEIMSRDPDRAEKMMRKHTQYGTNIDISAFEKLIEQL